MTRHLFTFALVLMLAGALSAQQADVASLKESTSRAQSGIGINPAGNAFSLLDVSRIDWSHSYSVSFFSGGGYSGSVGLLNTTMDYDISSKLHLALNLGLLHNPGALWTRETDSQARLLPGVRLDFRPSDNVFMSLSFQQVASHSPYYYYPYERYHRLQMTE